MQASEIGFPGAKVQGRPERTGAEKRWRLNLSHRAVALVCGRLGDIDAPHCCRPVPRRENGFQLWRL